jgi:hypothetical protein
MSKKLVHTCLPATGVLETLGFATIVAREADRVPIAVFKNSEHASVYCDHLNDPSPTWKPNMDVKQDVKVDKVPAPSPAPQPSNVKADLKPKPEDGKPAEDAKPAGK